MLKLDFNERSDSTPKWLKTFSTDTSNLWKYPNRQEVEELIANKLHATKEQVFLSNGGDESIDLLFKLCKLNQQQLLLPAPAFSQYTHQLNIWDLEHTLLTSMNNLAVDITAIRQNIHSNQWLVLTRPNNPTGECLPEDVLIDLIKTAKSKGANVFLDEAYIEFYLENSATNYALKFDNVISLRTFSKAFGLAGARVGYLVGNENLINKFKQIAPPFNVNQLSLQLAKLALENIDEVNNYCALIARNRQVVYELLKSCNIEVFDGKGNFLLFRVSQKIKILLSLFMSKSGIQIKNNICDLPDCVRITIPENINKLLSVLQTVFNPEIIGFDMDGVLIDTSKSYDECIIKTVTSFTKENVSKEQITNLRAQGGFNNDWDLSQALIEQQGIKVEYSEVVSSFQQFYNGKDGQNGLKQNELNLLKSKSKSHYFSNKYITAIITGRPKPEAIYGVEQLSITPDFIISADDVSQQKPSPQGINWLKSTCKKNRMWFCGDTVDDMQAGLAANCVCIGIGNNVENLYQAGADIVLENINELSELL